MAVSIPSDLVVDVMRAADPARLQRAVSKLSGSAEGERSGAMNFSSTLANTQNTSCLNILPVNDAAPSQGHHEVEATRQGFEQMVWRSLYETVLPEEKSGVFGGGPSAGIWRSMAADQLASVASKNSSLKILDVRNGDALAATRDMANGESLSGWPYFATSQIRSYAG